MEDSRYDHDLSAAWLDTLHTLLPPLRHAVHGLQMAACYVGQMAPGSRIAVAALFQAADEMRRVQRLAYRMRALQYVRPGFGADARSRWQSDPLWQPLRAAIERILATYDWGQAFAALNLVLKPLLDDAMNAGLGGLARAHGDDLFARVLASLGEDAEWHRAWTRALVTTALAQESDNQRALDEWVRKWTPTAQAAVQPFAALFTLRAEALSGFLSSCGLWAEPDARAG
jgi:hypothetical protein